MASQIKIPTNTRVLDEVGFPSRVWYRFFTLLAERCGIIEGSTTTSATGGGAGALPATPAGYITITKDGVDYKVPYYNV